MFLDIWEDHKLSIARKNIFLGDPTILWSFLYYPTVSIETFYIRLMFANTIELE